jgi:hypothetical protein
MLSAVGSNSAVLPELKKAYFRRKNKSYIRIENRLLVTVHCQGKGPPIILYYVIVVDILYNRMKFEVSVEVNVYSFRELFSTFP